MVWILHGVMNEDAHYDPMSQGKTAFIVNFRNVTTIDSCGVRNWVNFMRENKDRKIMFEHCSPVVVRQMNMIPNFVAHAEVLSIYVSLACNSCNDEKLELIEKEDFGEIPRRRCQNCGDGDLELDTPTEQYFAFLKK